MSRLRTHYDNLKVARDAPPEVIRAAYKTLTQRFHPDRNPDDAEAARIMTIINASYAVLSDPQQRQAHDAWIARQESAQRQSAPPPQRPPAAAAPQRPMPGPTRREPFSLLRHAGRYWMLYVVAGVIAWGALAPKSPPPPGPKPYVPAAPAIAAGYVKPLTAPNGEPWPPAPGYVHGYERLHGNGLSSVTVDNSRNDADVFVKLVSLEGAQAYPVRTFFIPAHRSFTVNKVRAGRYDIRYRDLDAGDLSRSEAFALEEVRVDGGTRFSQLTMTLYKVENGNMQTHRLSEAEF